MAELQQLARRNGISGISRLRKAELIDQLINAAAQP
ncbi:MAG: Rho termination factor N-terminal domain-containing protein [Vulcanococcus sp.]